MLKPWLWLPTKLAHNLAPWGLRLVAAFRETKIPSWRPLNSHGLSFKNRVGIAGGLDKNGETIEEWWTFGPGFIEIGTVTPRAQGPNPGTVMARDIPHAALWNRMGFPGQGAQAVLTNLRDLPSDRPTPIFVNIGKNRDTTNADAANDYVSCMETLNEVADAFVINISSPNTAGLRELFARENFAPFLSSIMQRQPLLPRRPVLLKLSPDLPVDALQVIVSTALELGVNGFIATNTTLARPTGISFPTDGGLSGQPLAAASKHILREVLRLVGSARARVLIISAGGVMTPADVVERLEIGADLVQVYTTLVFNGPGFFGQVAAEMLSSAVTPRC